MSDSLIKELEEMSTNVSKPLEKRLVDTAVWFHKNKDRIPREAVQKRMDFVEKALDIIIEMNAMLVQRLHEAEGRGKSSSLYLPSGVRLVE